MFFFNFSANTTQLTNCTRNYCKHSEILKNNLNSAQLDTLRSVNLIRIKELKLEDLSSLSIDFLSSKCTKCKYIQLKKKWCMNRFDIS